MISFSLESQIDPVALYAAVVSTLIALWELYKWLHKNEVRLNCSPNMEFINSIDKNKYVLATLTNLGDKPTTITHFHGMYYETFLNKIRKKNGKHFIVNSPDIPKIIEPGEQWMGKATQDKRMEEWLRSGYLYMGINHSMSTKPTLKRVFLKDKEKK